MEDKPAQLQEPGIAPPERLCLTPGAVEQHNSLETRERWRRVGQRRSSPVERDDAAGHIGWELRRAEIEHAPLLRIRVASQSLRKIGPAQPDFQRRMGEEADRQSRRPEITILFLWML